MIRELMKCQIHDPGKGSFLVNPMPVKEPSGQVKFRRCRDGAIRPVYRASHYKNRDGKRGSVSMVAHPEAMEFVIVGHDGYAL